MGGGIAADRIRRATEVGPPVTPYALGSCRAGYTVAEREFSRGIAFHARDVGDDERSCRLRFIRNWGRETLPVQRCRDSAYEMVPLKDGAKSKQKAAQEAVSYATGGVVTGGVVTGSQRYWFTAEPKGLPLVTSSKRPGCSQSGHRRCAIWGS